MSWVDALGWAGSALLIYSLTQARVLRLRALNLIACLVLTVFNAILMIWPMVAMNVVLSAINIYFIVKLLRQQHDHRAYTVLEVEEDDTYLTHFLSGHRTEIDEFFPGFASTVHLDEDGMRARPERSAYLVQLGDETVGAVVIRDDGDGLAQVELDYVTPRYRDFTPGEFVWRDSGLFRRRGFQRVRTPEGMVAPYYAKLGFTRVDGAWELALT